MADQQTPRTADPAREFARWFSGRPYQVQLNFIRQVAADRGYELRPIEAEAAALDVERGDAALTRDQAIDGWLRLYQGNDVDVATDVGRFYDEVIAPVLAAAPAPEPLDVERLARALHEFHEGRSDDDPMSCDGVTAAKVAAEYVRLAAEEAAR